ncbi:DUF1194 domain-containing protein [Paracoccus pacificus]|uniref:DUF1194 domain-containing protein n=1 Tax=Paracoccus pacificus TaxID=1463598 RepID=A0ABW4RBR5_9RHOB
MRHIIAVLMLFSAPIAALAQDVELELVLLTDASGSIDAIELELQRRGYANAMTSPEVLAAIADTAGGVAVTYVEFADTTDVIVPWMVIGGATDARRFADALMGAPRESIGGNAIGAALLYSLDLIEKNDFNGWRKVIDFSSDSLWNGSGPPIASARQAVLDAGITINGLPVLCLDCSGRPTGPNLEQEYLDRLIGGSGAFMVTADGDESFETAVRRKMVLEIAGTPVPADPRRRVAMD